MADIGETAGGIIDSIFGGTFTVVLWVIIGFFIIAVGGLLVWYFFSYRKRFDIMVKIVSERSGDNRVYFDRGAILRDKKNNTDYLKLWSTRVELELPKFNIMHHTNKGDYIELFRESERGFRFLKPPRIDRRFIIKHDGKKYPIADLKQYQIENDLTWILERQKVNKSIINPESIFMKLLQNAPQIISMAVSLVLIMIIMRAAPQLLAELSKLIETLKEPETTEVIASFIPILWSTKWLKK